MGLAGATVGYHVGTGVGNGVGATFGLGLLLRLGLFDGAGVRLGLLLRLGLFDGAGVSGSAQTAESLKFDTCNFTSSMSRALSAFTVFPTVLPSNIKGGGLENTGRRVHDDPLQVNLVVMTVLYVPALSTNPCAYIGGFGSLSMS